MTIFCKSGFDTSVKDNMTLLHVCRKKVQCSQFITHPIITRIWIKHSHIVNMTMVYLNPCYNDCGSKVFLPWNFMKEL